MCAGEFGQFWRGVPMPTMCCALYRPFFRGCYRIATTKSQRRVRVALVADVAGSLIALVVEPERIELAVERRAADAQPPRHLRHLSAIMRDRESDGLGLDLLERAYVAGGVGERQH